MNLEEALGLISNFAYDFYKDLEAGLPDGKDSEIGYDEQLAIELGTAYQSWITRQDCIQNPYCVWFFDGESWSKATEDLYEEDAYKKWYQLTSNAKENNNASFETYYYFGSSKEVLSGRHPVAPEDDGFSIGYLLDKSFGD